MNNDTLRWLVGGIIASAMGWSSYITLAVWEDRTRLVRIETKVDILIERLLVQTNK